MVPIIRPSSNLSWLFGEAADDRLLLAHHSCLLLHRMPTGLVHLDFLHVRLMHFLGAPLYLHWNVIDVWQIYLL